MTTTHKLPEDAQAALEAIGEISKAPEMRLDGHAYDIADVDEFMLVSRDFAALLLNTGPVELTVEVKRA